MMSSTVFLAISTGLSLNLIIQFGFGIRDIVYIKNFRLRFPLYQCIVLFFTVILIWLCFTYVFYPLGMGFMETLILIPLTILFCWLLEQGIFHLFPKWLSSNRTTVFSAYNGIVFAAGYFTLQIAGTFMDALVMSLGFALGCFVSIAIVHEINKRSSMEAVPAFLRGSPLLLISMGLLSLIFTAAALLCLQIAGVF